MMCEACERDEHWNCGMQTWCECDCPGQDDVYLDVMPESALKMVIDEEKSDES